MNTHAHTRAHTRTHYRQTRATQTDRQTHTTRSRLQYKPQIIFPQISHTHQTFLILISNALTQGQTTTKVPAAVYQISYSIRPPGPAVHREIQAGRGTWGPPPATSFGKTGTWSPLLALSWSGGLGQVCITLSASVLRYFKSTHRGIYDLAWRGGGGGVN